MKYRIEVALVYVFCTVVLILGPFIKVLYYGVIAPVQAVLCWLIGARR